METMQPHLSQRFRNYDLLRAMTFFAMGMRQRCLDYLKREIRNHGNDLARQFIRDYFESPSATDPATARRFAETTLQGWRLEKGIKPIDTGCGRGAAVDGRPRTTAVRKIGVLEVK